MDSEWLQFVVVVVDGVGVIGGVVDGVVADVDGVGVVCNGIGVGVVIGVGVRLRKIIILRHWSKKFILTAAS